MVKILFVCTGNMFRSASAEYSLKRYLFENKEKVYNLSGFSYSEIQISSAGTAVRPQAIHKAIVEEFKQKNINMNAHIYMQIDTQLIKENDLIIAMGEDHQKYLKKTFNLDVPLFNEICYNKHEGILDDWEKLGKHPNPKIEEKYLKSVVDYIYNSMPNFTTNFKHFIK